MKINEKDIKYMVNECVKHIIKESIDKDLYKNLAEQIISSFDDGNFNEDVFEVDGIAYRFDIKVETEEREFKTGVEFMGDEEKYYRTEWYIKSIFFDDAYNEDGEKIDVQIDGDILKKFIDIIRKNNNYI